MQFTDYYILFSRVGTDFFLNESQKTSLSKISCCSALSTHNHSKIPQLLKQISDVAQL